MVVNCVFVCVFITLVLWLMFGFGSAVSGEFVVSG